MNKLVSFVICILTLSFVSGCSVANYVVDPYTTLDFKVSENVNPNVNGRASPVVVRVFELSSRTLFESQDFFTLFDDASGVLGPELISKSEFEFEPGQEYKHSVSLRPGVRYAGILVAYQDIDNASWREIVEISPTSYSTVTVNVGELSVFISN